jgi:Secretion system C-terminal sorting domain
MKKIIIISVFFAFFACADVFGQSLTVTCNSIRINGVSSPNGLFTEQPNQTVFPNNCRVFLGPLLRQVTTTFFLDKVENGGVTRIATQQTPLFDNLQPGTYIASFSQPSRRATAFCTEIEVLNSTGARVGIMTDIPAATQFAPQPVGAPAQSDNQYTFLNGNQSQFLPTLFDPNEAVRINTSACKNFDEYQINIQEFWFGDTNQPGRWISSGYLVDRNGNGGFVNISQRPLNATEDLKFIWTLGGERPDWVFIPGNSYRVQLTIRNSTCNSWNDNLQTFFVCQPTWGCRGGVAETKTEPSISPNPVSRAFRVEGVTFNPVKSVTDELVISDLMGRTVKNFSNITGNEFDVSDLQTGAYFVSVLRNKHKMFTKKLMVSH